LLGRELKKRKGKDWGKKSGVASLVNLVYSAKSEGWGLEDYVGGTRSVSRQGSEEGKEGRSTSQRLG